MHLRCCEDLRQRKICLGRRKICLQEQNLLKVYTLVDVRIPKDDRELPYLGGVSFRSMSKTGHSRRKLAEAKTCPSRQNIARVCSEMAHGVLGFFHGYFRASQDERSSSKLEMPWTYIYVRCCLPLPVDTMWLYVYIYLYIYVCVYIHIMVADGTSTNDFLSPAMQVVLWGTHGCKTCMSACCR